MILAYLPTLRMPTADPQGFLIGVTIDILEAFEKELEVKGTIILQYE